MVVVVPVLVGQPSDDDLVDAEQKHEEQEEHEPNMVPVAHAVVDVRAVVVISFHSPVAHVSVS